VDKATFALSDLYNMPFLCGLTFGVALVVRRIELTHSRNPNVKVL
jgi:hypothetical protein